jgi:uncharacterized protein (TIGR03382 family)
MYEGYEGASESALPLVPVLGLVLFWFVFLRRR